MNADWRINWQMPAEPLMRAKPEPRVELTPDHIAALMDAASYRTEFFGEFKWLPEGINEKSDGQYEAECCRCERWGPIYCDLKDIPDVGYKHYCGGSPMCCP